MGFEDGFVWFNHRMIKAVAFDLWETLITDTPQLSRAQERLRLQNMATLLGTSEDRIEAAYKNVWHHCQDLYWSRDEDIPCRRQVEHFLELAGIDADDATVDALEHAYAMAAVEMLPAVVEDADAVVAALKDRGYRIGLISNTGRTPGYALRLILERLGLAPSIDAMVFSNEHGACKPRPSIFETLRTALGVPYSEMIFVGDNLYVDVHGAQRCGMLGVHFVPPRRGTAIAPPVDHGLEIVPDATITHLRQLSDFCDRAHSARAGAEARSR
jgi:putative hydrolase of the HAD superfamily